MSIRCNEPYDNCTLGQESWVRTNPSGSVFERRAKETVSSSPGVRVGNVATWRAHALPRQ